MELVDLPRDPRTEKLARADQEIRTGPWIPGSSLGVSVRLCLQI